MRHPPLMRMGPSVLTLLLSLNHQQTQYLPKKGKLLWSIFPLEQQGRLSAANIIKMVAGPTRHAVNHVQNIKSASELLITPSIEKDILEMTNLEGRRGYGDSWKDLDVTHLQAYTGLQVVKR